MEDSVYPASQYRQQSSYHPGSTLEELSLRKQSKRKDPPKLIFKRVSQ